MIISLTDAMKRIQDSPQFNNTDSKFDTRQRFRLVPNEPNPNHKYVSQQQHWVKHLEKLINKNSKIHFKTCYNKILCTPMLEYLANVAGIETASIIEETLVATENLSDTLEIMQIESKIFRQKIPFERISSLFY